MPQRPLGVHAIILAGGRGTRFWPRSRTKTPKQLLNIVGKTTMLEQTVERLRPLIPAERIWTVTNWEQAASVKKQLPAAFRKRVLTEPLGRNTAAAIALAAVHVRQAAKGEALLAVLPADHYIAQPERYLQTVSAALELAREPGRMVVLGIPPTRPETGYGYIERDDELLGGEIPAYAVRRFTEKPALAVAKEYVASGRYYWNAGVFCWRASTFLEALKEFLPHTYELVEGLSRQIGKPSYEAKLKGVYAKLENISVDYAVLEKARTVVVVPAEIGWSDIGSWAAVYELLAKRSGENIFAAEGQTLDADGNFFWSPKKFIAAIGVHNFVVVETPDAILICPRERAQDVSKIVKSLEERKLKHLL